MKTLPVVAFACSAVLAQAPASPLSAPAVPVAAVTGPLTAPLYDEPGDGRLWVAAPGYKASFGADGFLFVPFLGSDAERNWPVRFGLAAVTVGEARLPLAPQPVAHDGELVTIDHGGLREVHRIGAHEVEQMFCFTELPQRGELTVRLAVQTDLEPTATFGGGFEFTGPRGGVRYGSAPAIDARGNRLALDSQWTGDGITITVPAAFVATAALPLWIDPVVGSIVNGQPFSATVYSVDVASAPSWDQYASAFAFVFSFTDHDVYCQRYTAAMAPLGNLQTLDSTLDSWSGAKIAYLETTNQYLIVAGVKTNAVNDYWIGARTVPTNISWGNSAQLPVARAPVAGQYHAMLPDVGGDSNPGGTSKWTIVWQQGAPSGQRDIYMRQMGAGLAFGPITALTTTVFDQSSPCISRTNGIGAAASRNWMVVWHSANGANSLLNGCSLLWDGQVRTNFTAVSPVASYVNFDVSSPTEPVSGLRQHLVVFDANSAATTSLDVWGTLLTHWGVPVRPATNLTLLETNLGTARNLAQYSPAVDCDGLRFTVAYVHEYTATDLDVRAMTVANLPGNLAVQDSTNVGASFDGEYEPSVAASLDGPARMLIGWRKATTSISRAEYRLYDAMAAAGGFAVRATGCGGLPIAASGLPALGAEFTIAVQGTGLQGFVAGLPANLTIPPCPGCTQGVSGNTVLAGTMSVTVPPDVSFLGLTLAFQGFDFGGAACLNAVRVSDTIDVTIR